ncbi:unnamed protein product [Clavelina lepadiformis]|uniref:Uncharacterized protein n=1 Tax=Clavelina lepadiformis TaxID=159417 RepID=A0ABP0GRA0_CLALP
MDVTFAYGSALSCLSEANQQKYSAEFKKYLQKALEGEAAAEKEWKGYQYHLVPGFEPATAQFACNQWNPCKGTTWMRELA